MTTAIEDAVSTLHIQREVRIKAPVQDSWQALLDTLGPASEMPGGQPFPMKLEAWPGGRWYRDLGNNTGHHWAHVQVIKPPALLELHGPMFMSYAAVSHIQYRLKEDGAGTLLTLCHRAFGTITEEHRTGVSEGWEYELEKIRERAERRL
ncbi:MAG TPA: SRPBCC domain-containing protein [Phycisphaerales bacterium]|nr:SRPBCC domain-containing protein [Phycisphaerales bacterium]